LDEDDDDDTVSDDDWSPSLASLNVQGTLPEDGAGACSSAVVEPSDVSRNLIESSNTNCSGNFHKVLKQTSSRLSGVGFDDDEEVDFDDFPASPSVQLIGSLPFTSNKPDTNNSSSNNTPTKTTITLVKPLGRSISFSAFSSNTNDSSLLVSGGGLGANKNADFTKLNRASTISRGGQYSSSAQESDHYRMYFMKFIDLLVLRETARIVQKKTSAVSYVPLK